MRPDLKIADSMLDLIGDIPLVRLNRIGRGTGAEILVKPEFLNPSGSIKDRIAKMMIEDAERRGLIGEGRRIIEATTGNTGTALAFVAAAKGYDFVAYVPEKDRILNRCLRPKPKHSLKRGRGLRTSPARKPVRREPSRSPVTSPPKSPGNAASLP